MMSNERPICKSSIVKVRYHAFMGLYHFNLYLLFIGFYLLIHLLTLPFEKIESDFVNNNQIVLKFSASGQLSKFCNESEGLFCQPIVLKSVQARAVSHQLQL